MSSQVPKVEELVQEFEEKFGFIEKLSLDTRQQLELNKSLYVFKKLAVHYAPEVLQENPLLSTEDTSL